MDPEKEFVSCLTPLLPWRLTPMTAERDICSTQSMCRNLYPNISAFSLQAIKQ